MLVLRPLCTFLVAVALVLGTMVPASHQGWAKAATMSPVEHSMPTDCGDSDDDAAPPMPCGAVFCAGMALILVPVQGSPEPVSVSFGRASDQNGPSLSRFPDPDPPRRTLVS